MRSTPADRIPAERPSFSATRDRLGFRLGELARLLNEPRNVASVQAELNRLAQG